MSKADALGIAEFGLSVAEVADLKRSIENDTLVNATLFEAGYWRRNSGVVLLISRTSATLRNPVQRFFPEPRQAGEAERLQLL
eukprot:2145639-Prymnesium_polylepis.1